MTNHRRPRKRAKTVPSSSLPDWCWVPHWSSLSPDLVRCVGDIFLASGDIDYYITLRAVCRAWRAATDDPRGPDPRFRPRGWAMLGSFDQRVAQDHDSRRLFINVSTGRFLWKDMSMFRGYTWIGADDANGLLVLKADLDSKMWILNPFTGYLVRLPRPWCKIDEALMVAAHGLQTEVVYKFWDSCHVVCNGHDPACFMAPPYFDSSATVVTFKGRAYAIDRKGTVTAVKQEVHSMLWHLTYHRYPREGPPPLPRRGAAPLQTFLVDNAGEFLLVRFPTTSEGDSTVQVFRVELEGKALHRITTIGSRAIFLGLSRCLSVDARNLPGIEGNCIYYVGGGSMMTCGIWMCRLEDGSCEKFYESFPDISPPSSAYRNRRVDVGFSRSPPRRPLSLQQVLMDHPKYAPMHSRYHLILDLAVGLEARAW